MSQREVRIGHEAAYLLLADPEIGRDGEPWSVQTTLALAGLRADAKVWLGLEPGLPDYFTKLAQEWRGWDGAQSWAAYEGGLRLEAKADGLGHVTLSVQLRSLQDWIAEGEVMLDAGQLESVARELSALLTRPDLTS
jgi:hypothetical protein